jgi:hypothetical protein
VGVWLSSDGGTDLEPSPASAEDARSHMKRILAVENAALGPDAVGVSRMFGSFSVACV